MTNVIVASLPASVTPLLAFGSLAIRQDDAGRYCINDLHKAAGGAQRHRPKYWLATQQAQELIAEMRNRNVIHGSAMPGILGVDEKTGIPVIEEKGGIPPILVKQGLGTFVAKQLVYAYAMWISPSFHLKVIETFDAVVMQTIQQASTAQQRRIEQLEDERRALIDRNIHRAPYGYITISHMVDKYASGVDNNRFFKEIAKAGLPFEWFEEWVINGEERQNSAFVNEQAVLNILPLIPQHLWKQPSYALTTVD